MLKRLSAVPLVYGISLFANLFVLYFVFQQVVGITALNQLWKQNTDSNMVAAAQLAGVELNFGYVGFIHHFKNYVIRGDESYYAQTIDSYEKTLASLNKLEAVSASQTDYALIQQIKRTLEEYRYKIESIHNTPQPLSIEQRDQLVRVDDSQALAALNVLRSGILARINQQQAGSVIMVESLNSKLFSIALLLIPIMALSTVLTIRLIRHLKASTTELAALFDTSPDAVLYLNTDGRILRANTAAANIFGYTIRELKQLKVEDLIEPALRDRHIQLRNEFAEKEQTRDMSERRVDIHGLRKDKSLVDLRIRISAQKINGKMRLICVGKDLTQQNKLKDEAEHDYLTELSNRRFFDTIIEKEIQRSIRKQQPLSLLLIDLDNFKQLNDQYGHASGDKALIKVAEYLRSQTRSYDHLVRWGGDEFVILCPGLSVDDACNHASRIQAGFEYVNIQYGESLTLSIGVASNDSRNPMNGDQLLKAADKAVYAAKDAGRNRFKHYDLIKNNKIA